jgi:hypothetical protein
LRQSTTATRFLTEFTLSVAEGFGMTILPLGAVIPPVDACECSVFGGDVEHGTYLEGTVYTL